MMRRTLMMLLVALAAMFATTRAAQVPVCPPDDYDDVLAMMDNMTDGEKLDMLIELINAAAREEGSNHCMYKDAVHNAVVMQMDGDELGVVASDLMTPEVQSLIKPLFLSSVLEDDEDGYNEEFGLLMLLVASTDQNFEFKLVNGNDMANAATLRFTPDEIYEAVGSYLEAFDEDGEEYEEDDLGIDEDVDMDALLKEVVDKMEEYFQSEPDIDAHIWLDPQANRVVMSMTSDDFEEAAEISEFAYLFKPMFLRTMLESDVESNSLLFAIIASSGRGLQVKMYSPRDKSNPLVLDYTADELMEVIDSYEE